MQEINQEIGHKYAYQAPMCQVWVLKRMNILEQVSLLGEIENYDDGPDI